MIDLQSKTDTAAGQYWPERRHGNDGVPECIGNAGEGRIRYVLLGVEHDRGEYDDGHRQREHEEAELTGTRRQRVTQDPQTYKPKMDYYERENCIDNKSARGFQWSCMTVSLNIPL